MVAKIASGSCKPDGLLEVRPGEVRAFLDPLPIGRIWGVGPVAEARLKMLGIQKVGDLARMDPRRLEELLGDWGLDVGRLARGEEYSEVEPYRDPRSYSEENTFDSDITDRQVLNSAIITHAESVARRLRTDRFRARTVVLKLKLGQRTAPGPRGYPTLSRRVTLPEATDDGATISRSAMDLLARSGLDAPVRLLGVGVANIVRESPGQLSLFEPREREARRERLNVALDEISRRFGNEAITEENETAPSGPDCRRRSSVASATTRKNGMTPKRAMTRRSGIEREAGVSSAPAMNRLRFLLLVPCRAGCIACSEQDARKKAICCS